MPSGVQDKLARDSFIRVLSPTELCRHVQMAEPPSLRVAVEVARKRELNWGVKESGGADKQPEVTGNRQARVGWRVGQGCFTGHRKGLQAVL